MFGDDREEAYMKPAADEIICKITGWTSDHEEQEELLKDTISYLQESLSRYQEVYDGKIR